MKIQSLLLSMMLLDLSVGPISAQSSNSNISASTHCRDSNGLPRLKSAANPSSAGSATASSPSSSPSSAPTGGSAGIAGSGNTTGSAGSGSSSTT